MKRVKIFCQKLKHCYWYLKMGGDAWLEEHLNCKTPEEYVPFYPIED